MRYRVKITIKRLKNQVIFFLFQFAKLKNKTSIMWLYGIRLTLTDSKAKEDSKMFDQKIINKFLLSFNKSKSKNVEMANKVFQSFNGREPNTSGEDIDACLAKFIGMGLMNHGQRLVRNEKEKQKSELKDQECKTDPNQNNVLDIRTYIDKKIGDMEKKLMERIDQMEQKTDEKLDKIIKILDIKLNST